MVNYTIVKFDGSSITGQANSVVDAVAAVNRAQGDPWSSEGRLFVAAYVGENVAGLGRCLALVENGGQWFAPEVEGFTAMSSSFGSLAKGTLFTLSGGRKLYRKVDDTHGQAVGINAVRKFIRRSELVVLA